MTPTAKFTGLVQMLHSFIEGKESARGTKFVREIESEFARLGLDEKEELSGLQHSLAMYRGHEDDISDLITEAKFAVRRPPQAMNIQPNQALQHNDPSSHAPCVRTCRASRGRG